MLHCLGDLFHSHVDIEIHPITITVEQVGVTCAFVRVKGIRFHYFGGFQQTSTQFSRSSKSLFQNSKLPIAPMFLQIFQYLWFLLQIPEICKT